MALADLLADPSKDVAFVAVFEERDPATDTVTERRTATVNWRGGEGYSRRLIDPGDRDDRIEGDELEALAEQTFTPVKLDNTPTAPGAAGPWDFLADRSLAGRPIAILAGAPEAAIATYEAVATGVMAGEPIFDGGEVLIRRKGPLDLLDVDLDVASYVGEPGALRVLVSGNGAATADHASHHLTRFTLAGRFRADNVSSAAQNILSSRRTGTTAENWNVFLRGSATATPGVLRATYSVAGAAGALTLTSGDAYDDGQWHWWALARRPGQAYLMVDGVVVAESTSPGTPDTPTSGITMGSGFFGPGDLCDLRAYDQFIAADEMRSAMAVRAAGDEEGLVGLWRADDQLGNTLTDYSATAAHGTISGTEDVDFEWLSSDLGTAELAGRSMPALIGDVWHAEADLVDPHRERWRASDRMNLGGTPTVRDQGELLSVSTDYAWALPDAVLELVAEAGEPLTVGRPTLAGDGGGGMVGEVLPEIVADTAGSGSTYAGRGPLAIADLDSSRLEAMYQARCGLATRKRPVREVAEEFLRGGLGFLAADRDGVLRADVLVPPTSPSPRDGACLEFSAAPNSFGRVTWNPVADVTSATGHLSFALWVKVHRWGPSEESVSGSRHRITLLDFGGAVNGATATLYLSLAAGVPRLEWERGAAATLRSASLGSIFANARNDWHFIAAVNDPTAGTATFYHAKQGGTLAAIGATTDLGFTGAPTAGALWVGQDRLFNDAAFRGSIFEPQVWKDARTLAELQGLMATPPVGNESDLIFYATLDGAGATSLVDKVSSAAPTVQGDVREVPDLTIDLRLDPKPFAFRRLRPAHEIAVEYRRNFAPLGPADIVATVDQEDALDLRTEARFERWEDPTIAADYLDSRAVTIPSYWATRTGAMATLRLGRYRLAPERQLAELSDAGRRALLLAVNNEVRVYGYRWGLDTGPVYRVTRNRARFAALTSDLELWR